MTADVLIVGAGSAGSIVAERLSADPSCRVTVVEPGPGAADPVARSLTADALSLPIGPDSPVARRYRATLTERPPRESELVRGIGVGGSGAVNGGYFWRPQPGDVEPLPGWSQAEVDAHYDAVASRIPVRPAAEFGSTTAAFVDAVERAGLAYDAVPLNIANGQRIGPGAAFLIPALDRPNLTVLTGARVTRIRVAGGRAIGVDAVGPSGPVQWSADRVVLCAGAIESAHLLLLSGVGPADSLTALGIPVVADLSVGQRTRDHPEWVLPTGWRSAPRRPVLEAVLMTGSHEIRPYTTGFGAAMTSVGVALMRPRAHGTVSLVATDPGVAPRIEHRYDSEPADIADLRSGCELVREILGGVIEPVGPAWSTSQHLCGTAPMGMGEQAVVDPQCRVHGVEGLWVIDGSVLARIPARGPHATIATVAHRAAEFVR